MRHFSESQYLALWKCYCQKLFFKIYSWAKYYSVEDCLCEFCLGGIFKNNLRVRISELWITIRGSTFVISHITLSNFLWNSWILRNFYLQENHKESSYTSSLTIRLYLTSKIVKLYTIFLHLDNILASNPQWGNLKCSPILPSC